MKQNKCVTPGNCDFTKSQPKLLIFMVKGKSSDTKFKYLLDFVIILLIHVTFSETLTFSAPFIMRLRNTFPFNFIWA